MLARFIAVSFCLLSFPAAAQQAQVPAVSYTITLEAKDVGEIAAALGERPFNKVAPLMQSIGRQIEEQNKAREWEKAQPATPMPPAQEAPK